MRRKLSVIATPALLFVALSAAGATEYYLTTDTGAQLPGGSICFSRINAGVHDVSPAAHWFTGKDVRCFPTNTLLDLPVGMFHFFATHRDGFVTGKRELLESTELAPEESYKKIQVEVVPAGFLDFSSVRSLLRAEEYFAVWIADSERYAGTLLPAVGTGDYIMIPAGRVAVPLLIARGTPRLIGDVVSVNVGQRLRVEFRTPPSGTGDLVTWIETDLKYTALTVRRASAMGRFTVSAVDRGGQRFSAVAPLLHPTTILGALQIFKNLPAEPITVQLRGKTWEPDEIATSVASGAVTVTSRGLETVPAGSVTIRYVLPSTPIPVAAARTQVCPNDDATRGDSDAVIRFTLYRCREPKAANAEQIDISDCTNKAARDEPLSPTVSTEFAGLPAGDYVLEAAHAILGRQRYYTHVAPTDDRVVDLKSSAAAIFGRVTRLGQPVASAKLVFHDDTPNRGVAVTNEHGEFSAFVPQDPGMWPTTVIACDGSFRFTHVPHEDRQPAAPYNIDIPSNVLSVSIRDATTGAALPGARARYAVTDDEAETRVRFMDSATADAEGHARFENVPPRHKLHVCARNRGFHRSCAPLIVLDSQEERSVDLRMTRDNSRTGRVLGPKIDIGRVFWVQEVTGLVTEISSIAMGADGFFDYKVDHSINEYAVIASTNQALVVVPPSGIRLGEKLTIQVPPIARLRSFTIALNQTYDAHARWVTLSIAGRIVPADAFAFHMNNRRRHHMVTRTAPQEVSDIAETGPIVVHLLSANQIAPGENRWKDLFSLPEYNALIQHQALRQDMASVIFP